MIGLIGLIELIGLIGLIELIGLIGFMLKIGNRIKVKGQRLKVEG